jgi:quercetin 2,3-dioxygenase
VPSVQVRPAAERFRTQNDWLDSRHSFSFGRHYDAANTGFGLLLVNNDDVVAPGAGFDTHPHRDMEIVTWVLQGSLVHQDSRGNSGVIHPGLAQRMTAGSGIRHSERNDSWTLDGGAAHDRPVRFVQMWVLPDQPSLAPGYQQSDIGDQLTPGVWVPLAAGRGDAAVTLAQPDAALQVARLDPGLSVTAPTAPAVHLYLARGSVTLEGVGRLDEGDAVRLSDDGGQRVTAVTSSELLVWQMYRSLG